MGKKQPETKFKEKVLPLLRALPNSWFIKTQMVALLGIPDILGCLNGHFVALELKKSRTEAEKKHGRVRLQGHILMQIRNVGGYGEFLYPENWDEIYSQLSHISDRRQMNDPYKYL